MSRGVTHEVSGFLLGYDITHKPSFDSIRESWLKEIKLHPLQLDVPIVIVGNKCDLPNRDVSFAEGQSLAQEYGKPFFEISVKQYINVEEAIMTLVDEIMKRRLAALVPRRD